MSARIYYKYTATCLCRPSGCYSVSKYTVIFIGLVRSTVKKPLNPPPPPPEMSHNLQNVNDFNNYENRTQVVLKKREFFLVGLQFSSRWYLSAQESPYVLHTISPKFPQMSPLRLEPHFHVVVALKWGLLWPGKSLKRVATVQTLFYY